MVGRHLAQRVLRRLDGAKSHDFSGPAGVRRRRDLHDRGPARLAIDQLSSAPPIRRPVEAGSDMFFIFDPAGLREGSRGAGHVRGVDGRGDVPARRARLHRRYAEKNATSADLFAAFSRATGRDVSSAIATFLEQPGRRWCASSRWTASRIRISQEPFHLADAAHPRPMRAGRCRSAFAGPTARPSAGAQCCSPASEESRSRAAAGVGAPQCRENGDLPLGGAAGDAETS